MKLLADLHTHSKYSRFFHGKHTIEQMAITANELGLVEIAITDHSFKHLFGTNISNLLKAREEIDEINKWSKTKVLLGIEADIISEDGTIDIDEDVVALIDVLVVGYHRMIKTNFAGFFGTQKKNKASIAKATRAYLNAIEKYPVTIVSHLDSVLKTDLYKIGKACAIKGVMVEINNRHCKWTEEQVQDLIASGCMFVLSSDAHRREDIGVVNNAMNIVKKYNIPKELIANVELEEHEKTEDDIEIDGYYGIYQAKQKEKEEREEKLAEIRKTQFTNNLSDEMETKLRQIAREKGLHYEEEPDETDLFDEYQKFKTTFVETEELIKSAKDFLNENAKNEFDTQNEKVDDESFVQSDLNAQSDASQNIDDANNFNLFEKEAEFKNVQFEGKELGDIVQKSQNTENLSAELAQKTENIDNVETSESKEISEDDKVLNILQKKTIISQNPEIQNTVSNKTQLTRSGVDIVKNTEVKTQSKADSTKNGRSLESFMQSLKDEPKEEIQKDSSIDNKDNEVKTTNKKGRGGVFIGVIDDEDK